MKCLRCQNTNTVELWAGNGFVCPFCQKWYCGELRAVYLAKFGCVVVQAVAVPVGEVGRKLSAHQKGWPIVGLRPYDACFEAVAA
jgi:hypothetical protein